MKKIDNCICQGIVDGDVHLSKCPQYVPQELMLLGFSKAMLEDLREFLAARQQMQAMLKGVGQLAQSNVMPNLTQSCRHCFHESSRTFNYITNLNTFNEVCCHCNFTRKGLDPVVTSTQGFGTKVVYAPTQHGKYAPPTITAHW
jgi:hypothetical protein